MHRLLAASALLASACIGEDVPDYRPLEVPYLTQQIFQPSCGVTQCHSTFRQAANNVFDTPENVRNTLVNRQLVSFNSERNDLLDPDKADLIIWITETDPKGLGTGRMPYDAPLPNRDVKLLIEWISKGAPGAQCDPSRDNGKACMQDSAGRDVAVSCTEDWNFDKSTVIPCPKGCASGVCQ